MRSVSPETEPGAQIAGAEAAAVTDKKTLNAYCEAQAKKQNLTGAKAKAAIAAGESRKPRCGGTSRSRP